nr:hypothetical protein [Streptomyces chartreusis]
MPRIIRTSTLAALRAEAAKVAGLQEDLEISKAATGSANDAAARAEAVAERQLRELGQAHADNIRFQRERDEARTGRDQVEAEARKELDEIHADVAKLQDAARNSETGQGMREALAYRVLKDLVEDARARGLQLGRPLDLVAIVLGFDTEAPAQAADPVTAAQNP